MGLHTGEAFERDGGYFGPTVNRAARVMACGYGGQILCSRATDALVGGGASRQRLSPGRTRLGGAEGFRSSGVSVRRAGPGSRARLATPRGMVSSQGNLGPQSVGLVARHHELEALRTALITGALTALGRRCVIADRTERTDESGPTEPWSPNRSLSASRIASGRDTVLARGHILGHGSVSARPQDSEEVLDDGGTGTGEEGRMRAWNSRNGDGRLEQIDKDKEISRLPGRTLPVGYVGGWWRSNEPQH